MTAKPLIPITNIYYIFCYAWDRVQEAQSTGLGGVESPDLPNLLARVLLTSANRLLRRGLEQGYQTRTEDLGTVRGRIDLYATHVLRAKRVPRIACEFDELTHDVHLNRVLKSSLLRLSRAPTLNEALAHELRLTARRFSDVGDLQLRRSDFSRIRLHRNNGFYDHILRVAELAFDALLPDPNGEGYRFVDVLRDEQKMAGVFEAFVRNFYRVEQTEFRVEPLQILWDAQPILVSEGDRLPSMRTDIFLRSPHRRIIVDTKYYLKALQEHHSVKSFRSENLYQLYAYIKNAAAGNPLMSAVEGMLLYPQVGAALHAKYSLQGQNITLATVDLSLPWPDIASRLRFLLTE